MNAIRTTLAVVALGASGLTFAAGAFEGGQASNGLTFEPVAQGTPRAAADARAEGTAALRALNSRSGQQSNAEANLRQVVVSTRDRAEVRAEAQATLRGRQQAFEGGEATAQSNQRQDRVQPSATLASTGSVQVN